MLPAALTRIAPRARAHRSVTSRPFFTTRQRQPRIALFKPLSQRTYATTKPVDEKIEEIQDQYGTAQDEFEIATEETDKMSVYAEEDRRAAREEFDKLEALYKAALNEEGGDEVRQRVGQRIRELKNAVENLEEVAKNQD